jgi:hypothetical protein
MGNLFQLQAWVARTSSAAEDANTGCTPVPSSCNGVGYAACKATESEWQREAGIVKQEKHQLRKEEEEHSGNK